MFGSAVGADAVVWQKLASKLSQYQLKDDQDLQVCTLVTVGLQSAGKSRLLSALAGRMIAGAMKAKTGTRCPVVYVFENQEEEEIQVECKREHKHCNAQEASRWITQKMADLEQQELCGGTGFSEEELTVKISGPNSFDVTLVDLPGEKPDESTPQNTHIKRMIATYCSKAHVVPLIVTAFPSSLDVEHSAVELKRLLRTMGSHVAQKKALVLVNRLDMVRQQAKPEKLQDMVSVIEKVGLSSSRTCFLSLKPNLFSGQNDDEKDTDHKDFDFEVQDTYFRNIAQLDIEMMRAHASDLVPPGGGLHLGLQSVQKMLQDAQVTNLKARVEIVHEQLTLKGKGFRRKVKHIEDFSEEKTMTAMREYAKFMEKLAGAVIAGNTDMGSWNDIVQKMPHGVRHEHRGEIEYICDKTFWEEFKDFKNFVEGAETICSRDFVEGDGQQSEIAKYMNCKISGDAAIQRIGVVWTYKVMNQPLKEFSTDEMLNFDGWVDGNGVRAVSIGLIVQNCVNQLCESVVRKTIVPLCKWIAQLYIEQTRVTCQFAKEKCDESGLTEDQSSIRQLDAHPNLRSKLDRKLGIIFHKAFTTLADETSKEIHDLLNLRLGSLRLDDTYSLIRLLGCAGLSTGMLQCDGDEVPKHNSAGFLPDDGAQTNKSGGSLMGFFAQLPPSTVEQFAMGCGMQFRQIKDVSDLRRNVDGINELVHWITRVNIGLLTRDVLSSISLKMASQKLPMEIFSKPIQEMLEQLQSQKEFDKLLRADAQTRKQMHGKLLKEFESHLKIVAAMNESARELLELQTLSQSLMCQIPLVESEERDVRSCKHLRGVVDAISTHQQSSMECESDDDSDDDVPTGYLHRERFHAAQIRCLVNGENLQVRKLRDENFQLREELAQSDEKTVSQHAQDYEIKVQASLAAAKSESGPADRPRVTMDNSWKRGPSTSVSISETQTVRKILQVASPQRMSVRRQSMTDRSPPSDDSP